MTGTVQRRLRLPADHRSPAAARAAVRDILTDSGFTDLLDEALLLTSELSTNGVVHAGTDLDVEVSTDERGVTVTVADLQGGLIDSPASVDVTSEHGRGLRLVDHFATSWGTTHDGAGKRVWFRLERHPKVERPRVDLEVAREKAATAPLSAEACIWLLHIPDEMRHGLSAAELLTELLVRLCEVTGAGGGLVSLDAGDGAGWQTIAASGHFAGLTPEPVRRTGVSDSSAAVPLPVDRPMTGTVALFPRAGQRPADYWPVLAALSAERMALSVETERLRDADVRRRSWLTYLAETSDLLGQSLDVGLAMALVPQVVVPRLGEWAAVHACKPSNDLELAGVAHADESSLSVVKRLLGTKGTETGDRLLAALNSESIVPLPPPLEGVATALTSRGATLGTLSVGRPAQRMHTPDEIAVIQDVARRASLAIDNARIHADQERIAQDLQRALLPSGLPSHRAVEFGAEYVPAGTGSEVGGDFYDVLEIGDARWLVAVGDVCGKGAGAAAVTGVVRDVIRVLVRDGRTLTRTIELLNQTLLDQQDDGRYCTVALAEVSCEGDDLAVDLCLAGHDHPIKLHADGRTEQVGTTGSVVGLVEDVSVTSVRVMLEPGESLIFVTDGVTERRRGDSMYGTEGLCADLAELAGNGAQVIAARLRARVVGYSPDLPRDDIAVLVLRHPG